MGREAPKPWGLRLDLRTIAEPQLGLIHTKWRSRTGNRWARSREPQRDLPHKSKKNSQEQRCVRHSAAWLKYHIGLSNDQIFFQTLRYIVYLYNEQPSLLGVNGSLSFWSFGKSKVTTNWNPKEPRVAVGILCSLRSIDRNSLLGSSIDMWFFVLENRLNYLSSHV